jgi:hypothetical protein
VQSPKFSIAGELIFDLPAFDFGPSFGGIFTSGFPEVLGWQAEDSEYFARPAVGSAHEAGKGDSHTVAINDIPVTLVEAFISLLCPIDTVIIEIHIN